MGENKESRERGGGRVFSLKISERSARRMTGAIRVTDIDLTALAIEKEAMA